MAKDPNFTPGQRIWLAVGPYGFLGLLLGAFIYWGHIPHGLSLWLLELFIGVSVVSILGECAVAFWRRRKTARDGGAAAQHRAAGDAPRPSSRP